MRVATPMLRVRARAEEGSAGAVPPRSGSRMLQGLRWGLRSLGRLLLTLLVLLLGTGALLWWWTGSDQSLASALTHAAQYLPAGQQLESRAVSGSLRSGGRIGWLRWSSPQLVLEVTELRLGWQLAPLLQRRLELGEMHAARVQITPGPTPDTGPATAPTQWLLPLQVGLPFRIDQLQWTGSPAIAAQGLVGNYRFDGHRHQLHIDVVELAQGRYRARATLQARAPMALDATLDGSLRSAVPGGTALQIGAQATLQGTLATSAAQLQWRARIHPQAAQPPREPKSGRQATPSAAMQAELQATLAPWAAQPLQAASATLQAVNLAVLWPQAPVTQLQGTLQAGPMPGRAAGWSLQTQLRNALAGPLDQGRLPVTALQASADYDGSRWNVPGASVTVGTGSVTAQGRYWPATGALEGQVQLHTLRPDAWHSLLAAAPLSGRVNAQMRGQDLRFDADIRAAATAAPDRSGAALRINAFSAQGLWRAPSRKDAGGSLQLEHLLLDALQARIETTDLRLAPDTQSAQGRLALSVPGASAQATGQIAARTGAGQLQLQATDIDRTRHWLTRLPWVGAGLRHALQGAGAKGAAQLGVRWQGGWQTLAQQLQAVSAGQALPRTPPAFEWQATLSTAQLDLTLPTPVGTDGAGAGGAVLPSWQLRALKAELSGSLAQARLALSAELRTPVVQAAVQTDLSAGLVAAGQWQMQISALRLQAQDHRRPGPWTLQLSTPWTISARDTTSPGGDRGHGAAPGPALTLQTSAGQARLNGPLPGTVALHWQPVHWSRTAGAAPRLQTRGTLQGLPLAWVDALGEMASAGGAAQPAASDTTQAAASGRAPSLLARMGLASDILLDGQWNVDTGGDRLRASASLHRASGELRIQVADAVGASAKAATGSAGSAAGVRQAEVSVTADGDRLHARLLWASDHAGAIDASLGTRVTLAGSTAASAFTWAADAPLSGSLRARLPDIGLWSVLAPPGWRVRGTLDASATLSGTRNAPRWAGTLGADQMVLRSVPDGVDLQDGRLRATLRGNQLDITEFQLQGGRGSNARIAGFSGNRTPAPQDGGRLSATGRITWGDGPAAGDGLPDIAMSLQVQARALQLLVRADRQVSVSGQLQAQLQQGQISLHGNLVTDRATIILPDESAPGLGADVVVRSAAKERQARAIAQARQRPVRAGTAKPPEIAITLDLGHDFALQGQGITTRLTGTLNIQGNPVAGAPPRVTGEVRTEEGRYRAWGQMLDVETGLLRFNGPYDNPALDILALRPDISVRAGVQVTGSAQAPRAMLYSDPDLPDAEKLSWVVLGRNPSAGGAEAAVLQQAVLTLLGRKGSNSTTASVANRLGLDEIGFRGPAAGADIGSAALTFGKRLSRDLYVTYERSLSGTLGTLYIFYDLSRRLTLRGQTGEKSALDIIYTIQYD